MLETREHNIVGWMNLVSHRGLTRSGSEADSLLDLYGNDQNQGTADNDIPDNMYQPDQDDPDGWIHRDKLAKIESEELQAAGINLAQRRNGNKGSRTDPSRGRNGDGMNEDYGRGGRDEKRQRLSERLEEENDQDRWDFRNPEEIAADTANGSHLYANPILRKSGSKIPVLTSSPLPIPQEQIERDTPLPRKRTMSNSMTPEEGLSIPKMRISSIGNRIMLEDGEPFTPTPGAKVFGKPVSPIKPRTKAASVSPPGSSADRKITPVSRKHTIPTKIGTTPGATPSPHQRPGTRSGEMDRPRTAVKRPEGDPPWLATMYKPDPMLPPDQQIIPTHARQQQQAQWNTEGAIPSVYGRDFTPLAVHTGDGVLKQPSPKLPIAQTFPGEEENSWPLKPMSSIRNSGTRPGTSGSVTGSYSTMPKVTSPTVVQNTRMGQTSRTTSNRMQDQRPPPAAEAEDKVEKGCGCCVVM